MSHQRFKRYPFTPQVAKQMCWCFKVSFKVVRNLSKRCFRELLFCVYGMCLVCFCSRNGYYAEEDAESNEEDQVKEEFYKNVSREKAEYLLEDRQDGTFIIRPSNRSKVGVLSVVQDNKVFHLNIRRRDDDLIALGSEKINEKTFEDLDNLINYYISNYLVLYSDEQQTLTLLLPYRGKINS
ncbi:uncharacterized protein LOC123317517 [Coccinella septempunctata]|uniref:uncharacterized protein LOC123317517 n=1 Tax=Coccinella septempunctata TaxID=41139 RepID=UPI001D077277|nr:uncharacterized protein LOC123317517 [Coccinella septempunctata]